MNTTTEKSTVRPAFDSDLLACRYILMNLQNNNPKRFSPYSKSSDAGVAYAIEASEVALFILATLEAQGAMDSLTGDLKATWDSLKYNSGKADAVVTHKIKANVTHSIYKEVKGYKA